MFEESCQKYSNRPAFYNLGTTITFKELDAASLRFAAFLQQELKLQKGDRLAIMLPNLLQYPVAMFGALRAGLIVVNVNPLYTAPELTYQLKTSGAVAIVVVDYFAATVEKALPGSAIKHVITTQIGDMLPTLKGMM